MTTLATQRPASPAAQPSYVVFDSVTFSSSSVGDLGQEIDSRQVEPRRDQGERLTETGAGKGREEREDAPLDFNHSSSEASLARLQFKQRHLENLELFATTLVKAIEEKYDYSSTAHPVRKDHILPAIPLEELEAWREACDPERAVELYYEYRTAGLVKTGDLRRSIEESLQELELRLGGDIRSSGREVRSNVTNTADDFKSQEITRKISASESTDGRQDQGSHGAGAVPEERVESVLDKGVIYKAWKAVFTALGKILPFDRNKEVPIWYETLSTPPTIIKEDLAHAAVFGGGMETIESLATVAADLLKGLGAAIGYSTLVLHNPPLPLGCQWMDETMTVQNGVELRKMLEAKRGKIRAVFFGHIHQFLQHGWNGILYVAGPSTCAQFSLYPNAPDGQLAKELPGGLTVVRYFSDGISVMQIPIKDS